MCKARKPVPENILFTGGVLQLFDPKEVVQQQGRGATYTFTSEFARFLPNRTLLVLRHKSVFNADDRQCPPEAYEDRCLLWRGTQWRPWDGDERAQAMGLSVSIPSPILQADGALHCLQASMSTAVGNSFQVPSLMAMFMMLFQLLTLAKARSLSLEQEKELHTRLKRSFFEPGQSSSHSWYLES